MIRSFMVLLVLVVVFLVGVLFGTDREQQRLPVTHYNTYESGELSSTLNDTKTHVAYDYSQQEMSDENNQAVKPLHLTQKIASSLEVAINGFYEIIVGILYNLSSLFF